MKPAINASRRYRIRFSGSLRSGARIALVSSASTSCESGSAPRASRRNGKKGESTNSDEQLNIRCGSPSARTRWAKSAIRRDFPIPASPHTYAHRPRPARTSSHSSVSASNSRSRPTSGGVTARAVPAGAGASPGRTVHTSIGFSIPLSECRPRDSTRTCPLSSCRVLSAITISPGSASACTRAAMLAVSPKTFVGSAWLSTTIPLASPARTLIGSPPGSLTRRRVSSRIRSAVSTACRAACSRACG